jgi:F-type H+-transporting ATPase subunit b
MEMTWYEFTWAIINFLVLLLILYKLFYKPVLTFLENRRSEIARNLAEAEYAREKADELLDQYRQKLASAEKEAQEIIARATKAGEEERIRLIEQGHNEAAALLEKARAEIRKERDEALAALRKEIATLAVVAAGKILERTVTREDHERLVDEFLSEVGEVH